MRTRSEGWSDLVRGRVQLLVGQVSSAASRSTARVRFRVRSATSRAMCQIGRAHV